MNEFENILVEDDGEPAPVPPHLAPRRKAEIPKLKRSEIAPEDRRFLADYLQMLVGNGGYRHGRHIPFHQFAAEMRQLEQHAVEEYARLIKECDERGLPVAAELREAPPTGRARSLTARLVLIAPEFGACARNLVWLLPDESISEVSIGNVHDFFRRLKLEGEPSYRARDAATHRSSEGEE